MNNVKNTSTNSETQKKELDELPGFGKYLNEHLKNAFIKTIKKNKAGLVSK